MTADHPQPKSLTPEAAVRWGTWMVNGPVAGLMFGTPVLCGVIAAALGVAAPLVVLTAILAAVVGWCLAWLSWSWNAPRWKLWAYQRVDDLPRLKALAVEAKLIWPDGHAFERTEIRTKALNDALLSLEESKKVP